jgi:uncharacterized membrane protein YhiD involved in acid resistance
MFGAQNVVDIFVNPLNVIYFVVVSFILGLIIAWVYKKTNKSVSYSQSFIETLVLLLPVITIIILFISNNIAAAIGVFGAFTVVRFRTAVKDAKDMFFIFWVLATGLVVGVGEVTTAAVSVIAVGIMVFMLKVTGFGRFADYDYLLIYSLNTKKSDLQTVAEALKDLTVKHDILNVQSSKDGLELEVTQSIALKKKVTMDQVVEEINKIKGLSSLSVNPARFELEY